MLSRPRRRLCAEFDASGRLAENGSRSHGPSNTALNLSVTSLAYARAASPNSNSTTPHVTTSAKAMVLVACSWTRLSELRLRFWNTLKPGRSSEALEATSSPRVSVWVALRRNLSRSVLGRGPRQVAPQSVTPRSWYFRDGMSRMNRRPDNPLKLTDLPRHGRCLRRARAAPARSLTVRFDCSITSTRPVRLEWTARQSKRRCRLDAWSVRGPRPDLTRKQHPLSMAGEAEHRRTAVEPFGHTLASARIAPEV
jgi:hypothetical protein